MPRTVGVELPALGKDSSGVAVGTLVARVIRVGVGVLVGAVVAREQIQSVSLGHSGLRQ